ncbi:MAG TPA: ABC transporter ATP-binding protein [Solirubrobacterales bacterium]|nr:ABC transporter ATP-binding protein [Solirubrobacterales bacterium]
MESGPDNVIELAGVRKTYGEGAVAIHALRGVDLAIQQGEFVVLLGASGSGKTTLLNMIGGIEAPSEGRIRVAGQELSEMDEERLTQFRRDTVGFIFQFFNLIPTLTAEENVELIAELSGGDAATRSEEALRGVALAERSDHFPSQLSGGEQQRVAVARAIASDPAILLGDEPTGALDLETGRRVLDLLASVAESKHRTILLVTHNATIAQMANRVIRLRDGAIVGDERNENPLAAADLDW